LFSRCCEVLPLDVSSGRARPMCARTNSMALKSRTTAPLSRRPGVPMSCPKRHRLKHRAAPEPQARWASLRCLPTAREPMGPQKVDGDHGNLLPQALTNIALPGSGVPNPASAVQARHVGELFCRSPRLYPFLHSTRHATSPTSFSYGSPLQTARRPATSQQDGRRCGQTAERRPSGRS
jgi:hypothetical protein